LRATFSSDEWERRKITPPGDAESSKSPFCPGPTVGKVSLPFMKRNETIEHISTSGSRPDRPRNTTGADVWHYRELFFILAWRDIAVRYKQTVAESPGQSSSPWPTC